MALPDLVNDVILPTETRTSAQADLVTHIDDDVESEHRQVGDHRTILARDLSVLDQLREVLLGNAWKVTKSVRCTSGFPEKRKLHSAGLTNIMTKARTGSRSVAWFLEFLS